MTRAAIYARRSTEEHQAASLETQLAEARRFCEARGWTVEDRHVFTDSGASRSEFVDRPALVAMLLAGERKEFDVVVVRDESRLGGNMNRMALLIQDLHDDGVAVWCYFSGQLVEADSITARLITTIKAFADELEREKIAGRTREHLERKARAGLNVGGRAYGYDNVPVMDGERRARVEYRINDAEAAVVREVFDRYAAGDGLRAIAADLNARAVPSPHAGRRGSGSWGPTTLHDMLRRDRYRGVLVWGWRGTTYRKGTKVDIRRPAAEWTRADRPDLAIVTAAQWDAAHARIAREGRVSGHRPGPAAKSLLAGIARCAACGGPMQMQAGRFGSQRVPLYRCAWAHERGAAVCTVKVARPAAELDGALVAWLRSAVLSDGVVTAVLAEARRLLERAAPPGPANAEAAALEAELRKLGAEIARITTAIATTDAAPEALARALVERETRAKELRAKLAAAQAPAPAPALGWDTLEGAARAALADLRGAFDRNVGEARAALKALLRGPIACALVKVARGHRYRLTGEAVVPGLPGLATGGLVASPTGFEQHPGSTLGVIPFALVAGERRAA